VYLTYELLLCVQKREKFFLSLLAIINFSLIIWLGGRGAWLGVVCAMLFLIVVLLITKDTNAKNVFYVCSVVLISLLVSLPFNVFEWNGAYRVVNLFNMLSTQTIDSSTNSRLEQWSQAIELISDRFWFGYGLDSYKIVGDYGFFQPHNFILQILIELGFVGIMLIGFILTAPIIKNLYLTIKTKSINTLAIFFISILGAYVVQGLLDGIFYWPHPVMLIIISIAGICSLNNDYSSQTTNCSFGQLAPTS
jgi:O-antigen ligase